MQRFQATIAAALIILAVFFVYANATGENSRFPFKLGLDLAGGSHLVYEADMTDIDPLEIDALMDVLREVIEVRVNKLGVEENVVYTEKSSIVAETPSYRLIVELPGVTDVSAAVAEIGRTPLLEFKLLDQNVLNTSNTLDGVSVTTSTSSETSSVDISDIAIESSAVAIEPFIDTGLTGRYLESATLEFTSGQGGQIANEPIVSIVFNDEGGRLFETITRQNTGERLAIFLDGELMSSPRINEPISGGRAVISGGFTPDEARELAQNLNFGALPVPIALASTQTIGASLGSDLLEHGITAGVYGLAFISFFMLVWYRVYGVVAIVSLLGYISIMLVLFMLIPVTLTAAGLAGFVLSLGMAVDANVLVFERLKEELRAGKKSKAAAAMGFSRAWSAIRDGNITSILSAVVLFWFGTSIVKGFALVFGLGVIVSMFSAVVITRTLLQTLPDIDLGVPSRFRKFYQIGFNKK